jgi:hypothetical protein
MFVEVHSHLWSCTIALQRPVLSFEDTRWEVTALVAAENNHDPAAHIFIILSVSN